MTKHAQIDLSDAGFYLAAANTPLFLLRNLREDRTVQALAHTVDGPQLFEWLQNSLRKKPRSLTDSVAAYVYLVALSMKGDLSYLIYAQKLPATDYRWFHYLTEVLIAQFRPTSRMEIYADSRLISPSVASTSISSTSDASTDIQTIRSRR